MDLFVDVSQFLYLEECMLPRELKDVVIVHYMLGQNLNLPYARDITQLSSLLGFDERGIPAAYMSDLIQEQVTYPDPADTLIL